MSLNYPPRPAGDPTGGPCYRCVYPKPPPVDQVISCSDGGIVGPVVGAMGVLQAVEAIKLIVAGVSIKDTTRSEFDMDTTSPSPSLLLYSAQNASPFRTVRLRSRRPDCFACSAKAELSRKSLISGSLDYVAFCGETTSINLLSSEERISASEFARMHETGKKQHILIDVREKVQYDICSIDGSINIPFSLIQSEPIVHDEEDGDITPSWLPSDLNNSTPIYIVCKLGNDSQVVVRKLKDSGTGDGGKRYIGDIRGGLKAWREQVDETWPNY